MSSNYGLFASGRRSASPTSGTSRATSGRGHSPALTAVASVMAATRLTPVAEDIAMEEEADRAAERAGGVGISLRQLSHGHVLPRAGAATAAPAVSDVLELIPSEYRSSLSPMLFKIGDAASKLQNVIYQVDELLADRAAKNFKNKVLAPVGMPNLQICKIVADNNPEWKSGLEKEYERSCLKMLDECLKIKRNERDSLENCLAARDYVPPLVKKCKDVYDGLLRTSTTVEVTFDGEGNPQFGDPISSDLLKVQFHELCKSLPTLAARIIQIRRSQVIASHNKKERKTEIKEAARLRAATAPVEKTVEQLVQQEVRKKLGGLKMSKRGIGKVKKTPGKKSSPKKKTSKKNSSKPGGASGSAKKNSK